MTKMTLSEVIAKLKSNDPTFTKLNLEEVEGNVNFSKEFLSSYGWGFNYYPPQFNDEALLELAAAIKANQTLTRFEFTGLDYLDMSTKWTHIGTEAIGNALKDHPTLEELHLSVDPEGKKPIASTEICGILQALSGKAKIKNLYLTADLTDEVVTCLGKSIANSTSLECITIMHGDRYSGNIHKDDVLKTFASGFAGKSLQHLNLKLKLNDASFEIISQHLSMTNTLKTMTLNNCNITHASMIFIATILYKNPYLTHLDLSSNSLDSNSVKSLAAALPRLPKLKTLLLNKIYLDYNALDELAETWQKSNLKICTLEIGMAFAFSSAYIAAVKKIIANNKYLKKLTIIDHSFTKAHFYRLQNLLQDPSKCRLQKFSFGPLIPDDDFNNILIDILGKNPHLTMLSPSYKLSTPLTTAWKANEVIQKKSQQLFVEKVILFSNMYFSPPEDTKKQNLFSLFPVDVFLLILHHLGRQETFGMNYEDIVQCAGLIFENFSTRKKLIDEEKYSPIKEINSTSKAAVSKWWSLSSRDDNSKPVFRQRTMEDSKAEVKAQMNSESHTPQGNEAVDSKPVKPSTR